MKLKQLFFLTIFFTWAIVSSAQTNAITEIDSANTITYDDVSQEQKVSEEHNSPSFNDDVLGDTLIYFNDFVINKDSLIIWKQSKKYNWINNIDSLLKDKQAKSQKNFENLGKNTSNTLSMVDKFFGSPILKLLLWLIAFSFVAFILYKLFLSKGLFRFATKKQVKVSDEEDVENINDNDFEKLFQKSYAAGDLRIAMRYLFLKVLQKLNEKELIRFAMDKTNGNYLKELPIAKRSDFAWLTLYYEYIWYGNVTVEKQTFDMIEKKANEFLNKL